MFTLKCVWTGQLEQKSLDGVEKRSNSRSNWIYIFNIILYKPMVSSLFLLCIVWNIKNSMLHSMCSTCVFRIYISTCNGIIMIIILLHSMVRRRICVTVSVYCCWSYLTCRTYQMFVYSMASTLIYMRWYVSALPYVSLSVCVCVSMRASTLGYIFVHKDCILHVKPHFRINHQTKNMRTAKLTKQVMWR